MAKLAPLLGKDIKDLIRDPRIMIPFVISALIMPIIGVVIGTSYQQTITAVLTKPITAVSIVCLDNTTYSKVLLKYLESMSNVKLYTYHNLSDALANSPTNSIIVIPPGFGYEFEHYLEKGGNPPQIIVVQKVRSMGMGLKSLRASIAASIVINALKSIAMEIYNVSPHVIQVVTNPAYSIPLVFIVNRDVFLPASPQYINAITIPLIIVPIIVAIIGGTILQMSATSMALENEVRTLETLLTFPIPRVYIVLSKIFSSFGVGLLGSTLNIVGFWLYTMIVINSFGSIKSFSSMTLPRQLLEALGIKNLVNPIALMVPGPSMAVAVALSAIISILFLAVLGVLIGSLCSDVRIASTFMSVIMPPLIIGVYFIGFVDPLQLPTNVLYGLLSVPLIQTAIVSKLAITGVWVEYIPVGLLLTGAETLLLGFATAKLLNMDKLACIQYRLSRRFRR